METVVELVQLELLDVHPLPQSPIVKLDITKMEIPVKTVQLELTNAQPLLYQNVILLDTSNKPLIPSLNVFNVEMGLTNVLPAQLPNHAYQDTI